jgi:hypothetical protein
VLQALIARRSPSRDQSRKNTTEMKGNFILDLQEENSIPEVVTIDINIEGMFSFQFQYLRQIHGETGHHFCLHFPCEPHIKKT